MMPPFLQDLQLEVVFTSYCSNILPHVLTSNRDEHVVDPDNGSGSVFVSPMVGQLEEQTGRFFKINNPAKIPFSVLQIDHCIISTNEVNKCDCAIVDDAELSFIEFKTNATNTTTKGFRRNTNKAITQLKFTLSIFQQELNRLGLDLDTLRQVDCYVCFYQGYPRHTASEMNYCAEFSLDTGYALSFDPNKTLHQ